MADIDEFKSAETLSAATFEQRKLIRQLEEELAVPADKKYTVPELEELTKDNASTVIENMLAQKRKLNPSSGNGCNGFDKISFGMVYKLVYANWENIHSYAAAKQLTFREVVAEEYARYKECHDFVKAKAQEGGQK